MIGCLCPMQVARLYNCLSNAYQNLCANFRWTPLYFCAYPNSALYRVESASCGSLSICRDLCLCRMERWCDAMCPSTRPARSPTPHREPDACSAPWRPSAMMHCLSVDSRNAGNSLHSANCWISLRRGAILRRLMTDERQNHGWQACDDAKIAC